MAGFGWRRDAGGTAECGRRGALGLLALALLAGCGADDAGLGSAEPVTSVLLATTAAPTLPGPPTTTAAPSPEGVATTAAPPPTFVAPATAPPGQSMPDTDLVPLPAAEPLSDADAAEVPCRDIRSYHGPGGPSLEEAGRLEPMLGAVLAYGQQHADVWGGYAMTWRSSTDASVVLGITRDIAEHREALEEMVAFPDELVVCRSPLTIDQRATLFAQLQPELADRFAGGGPGSTGGVDVMLPDDQEAFAAELHARHGERVDLTVGNFPYPMPDPLPQATCGHLPDGRTIDGLEAVVDPPAEPLRPSATGEPRLTVRFRNTGSSDVMISFGQPSAVLLEPGGERIVGTFSGGMGDLLDRVTLGPGEHAERNAVLGATTCDPAMGYRLPAGTYDLVVILEGTVQDGPPVLTPRISVELGAP